jgi:hypothetical protein
MRGAVWSVTPLRTIRMREYAYNFSAYFRIGCGARTVLYLRLFIPSRNPQKTVKLRMIRSVKFQACGPNPRA